MEGSESLSVFVFCTLVVDGLCPGEMSGTADVVVLCSVLEVTAGLVELVSTCVSDRELSGVLIGVLGEVTSTEVL